MQKWEYAKLIIHFGGKKYCQLVYYTLEGPRGVMIEKEGLFAEEPDYFGEFGKLLADLGLKGWEMVNVTGEESGRIGISGGGSSGTDGWHVWLKRPLIENEWPNPSSTFKVPPDTRPISEK